MSPISKSILLVLCILGVSYWLLSGIMTEKSSAVRKTSFFQATLKAEPLIDAINKYTGTYKSAPKQLEELVPKFIDEIPETGLEECRRFKYANYAARQIAVLWYDLGSRHGEPIAKKSQYPDGDPGHSILTFTIGESDHVIDAKFDRMPKKFKTIDFDSEQWLAGEERIAMAPDLPEKYAISRMPRAVLEELLGRPDGVRVLRDAPWELRINCPRNLTERDVFLYWPTERYPEQIYGGNTELIGKWLFVQ